MYRISDVGWPEEEFVFRAAETILDKVTPTCPTCLEEDEFWPVTWNAGPGTDEFGVLLASIWRPCDRHDHGLTIEERRLAWRWADGRWYLAPGGDLQRCPKCETSAFVRHSLGNPMARHGGGP